MPSLRVRATNNAQISDDMFKGTSNRWQNCAIFGMEKSPTTGFSFTIKLPDDLGTSFGFAFGIVRTDNKMPTAEDIKTGALHEPNPEVGFAVICLAGLGCETWEFERKRLPLSVPSKGSIIIMRYTTSTRTLSVSVDGGAMVDVRFAGLIQKAEYAPYFVARDAGVSFQLNVDEDPNGESKKRKRSEDAVSAHVERMWLERRFTDAEIATATGSINVHRSVLCANPQFKAAFDGGYVESVAKKMRIDDVSHSTVEALVQYIYVREVPDEVNHHELLGLAHRFEQAGLVELCSRAIVDNLEASNICEAARALRGFKDDPAVSDAWGALMRKLASNPSMQYSVLMTV